MPIPSLLATGLGGRGVDLGALRFNQGTDDNGVEWWLEELAGWDSPLLREDLDPRALAHGAYRGSSFYGHRELTAAGYLVSPNGPAALQEALHDLAYETDLTDSDGILVVHDADASKQVAVRRSGTPRWVYEGASAVRFEVDLSAADPRKYGVLERTLVLAAGGSGSAVNGGRARAGAPLHLAFAGPLASPTLSVAGISVGLSTLASGETIVVDTLEETVLLGSATAYSRLTTSGPFPTLPPAAASTVSLSGSGAGSVTASWRDTWL